MSYKVVIWGMGIIYNRHVNVLKYLESLGQIKVTAVTATEIPKVKTIDGYQVVDKSNLKI